MTETLEGLRSLAAPIVTVVFGMVVLLLGLGATTPEKRRILPIVSILGLLFAALISTALLGQAQVAFDVEPAGLYFGRGMIGDRFGGLFCILLALAAALAIGMGGRFLEEKRLNSSEFYALLLFSASGAMLMALSYDLVNVFVGLEILSVSLYILSGFARRERRSEESAVKYFLLGAFASGFLLYGIALIYGSVGLIIQNPGLKITGTSLTNFDTIGQALRVGINATGGTSTLLYSPIFIAGVALVIVGLGFKAAIAPFHFYAPDVYEGAPTPVTAFMSVAAKAGALAALVRFLMVLLNGGQSFGPFHAMLWGLALATMLVGNILAVRQVNIKRMLAYSSIAHAGYILVGILAIGKQIPDTGLAQSAVLFYLFAYTLMNIGAFAVVVWLGRGNATGEHGEYLLIRDYAGLGQKQPLAALAMSIFMLSLAGIPLTAGFLGKLYLFMGAIRGGEALLAALGLVISAIGVFYYLNIIASMYFRDPVSGDAFAQVRGGGAKNVALLCALGTLALGIFPVGVLPNAAAPLAEASRRPRTRPVPPPPVGEEAAPLAPGEPVPPAPGREVGEGRELSPPPGEVTPVENEPSPAAEATPAPNAEDAATPAASPSPEASPDADASPPMPAASSASTEATPAPVPTP